MFLMPIFANLCVSWLGLSPGGATVEQTPHWVESVFPRTSVKGRGWKFVGFGGK